MRNRPPSSTKPAYQSVSYVHLLPATHGGSSTLRPLGSAFNRRPFFLMRKKRTCFLLDIFRRRGFTSTDRPPPDKPLSKHEHGHNSNGNVKHFRAAAHWSPRSRLQENKRNDTLCLGQVQYSFFFYCYASLVRMARTTLAIR